MRARYVVVDGSIAPDGKVLARDEGWGLALWKLDGGELISTTSVQGLYPNDTWSGREVTWRRIRCKGGTLRVTLETDQSLFKRPQAVYAVTQGDASGHGASVTVSPGTHALLPVRLAPLGPDPGRHPFL